MSAAWLCATYKLIIKEVKLLKIKGTVIHVDVYNIADYSQWSSSVLQQQIQPGKQTRAIGMDGWGFSTLFSGLGHSDPVLRVKYTLLLPRYFQFLFQTEFSVSWFSQLERPRRDSETVRNMSWKAILTSREKGKMYFLPLLLISHCRHGQEPGGEDLTQLRHLSSLHFQCLFMLHGLAFVLVLTYFLL